MARRRGRQSSRRAETILVMCQGEKTEPQYFEEMRRALRKKVTVRSDPKDPVTLVGEAARAKKYEQWDVVYIVVDEDDTPVAQLQEAASLAKEKKLHLIISHECFEVWLLAHARKIPDSGFSRGQLVQELVRCGFYDTKQSKTLSPSFPYSEWRKACDNVTLIEPNEVSQNAATAVPAILYRMSGKR